ASAAAAPWPSPSIRQASPPCAVGTNTARSPERSWPSSAAPATPRSSASGQPSGTGRPLDERHRGPHARRRLDLELVDQPARARQPEPETRAGRVAVGQRALDVLDPRPLVARGHADAAPAVAVAHDLQQ